MAPTRSASPTGQGLAAICATSVALCAVLGLVVSRAFRSGGGDHHCPAGPPSNCTYPYGPWHWGEGILVGSFVGLLVFLAGLAIWLLSRRFGSRRT